jgi:hypothetical protein
MPEYDEYAGFPPVHINAFSRVAARMKMVISSRELNPLCTDLVLENYAAKGFHIKAKTCDWGPMAGFVPADPRFTKGSQNVRKQEEDLTHAFQAGARAVPLFISQARYDKLVARRLIVVRPGNAANQVSAWAGSAAAGGHKFVLVKTLVPPPGGQAGMWRIYYDTRSVPKRAAGQTTLRVSCPTEPGLMPVMGMVNPENANGKLGVKSAVAGDYDLWCVFPHESAEDIGLGNRAMPLRATMPAGVKPLLQQKAAEAGLIFASGGEKAVMAERLENPHLGNISLGILKVKDALNQECQAAGYTAGNVVQHSDYGANPFGAIDYPLIFFIPRLPSALVEVVVARHLGDLQEVIRDMTKHGFQVKLNPAWTVPNF